jgi:hypothetical protein
MRLSRRAQTPKHAQMSLVVPEGDNSHTWRRLHAGWCRRYRAGQVDTFNADLSRFPNFRNAECTLTIVEPGEILYYPTGWWYSPVLTRSCVYIDLATY